MVAVIGITLRITIMETAIDLTNIIAIGTLKEKLEREAITGTRDNLCKTISTTLNLSKTIAITTILQQRVTTKDSKQTITIAINAIIHSSGISDVAEVVALTDTTSTNNTLIIKIIKDISHTISKEDAVGITQDTTINIINSDLKKRRNPMAFFGNLTSTSTKSTDKTCFPIAKSI